MSRVYKREMHELPQCSNSCKKEQELHKNSMTKYILPKTLMKWDQLALSADEFFRQGPSELQIKL